jgi:acetyl-CoA carboxylase biotin carboxylase subunit
MFDKILIANRGEIALRIQRACREIGIKTVVVHSEADTEAKYVKLADESVCIGPAPSRDSYLNIPAIISAAEVTDSEAIHPATASCRRTRLRRARREERLRVHRPAARLDPDDGRQGQREGRDEGRRRAGGARAPRGRVARGSEGGRADRACGRLPGDHQGVRRRRRSRHARGVHRGGAAERGDDDPQRGGRGVRQPAVYLEKFLENPRHIEIQVLADEFRNAVYLGERDCSMQRRHQKVIEEAPAPGIARRLIDRIGVRCVDACRKIGYRGAGTFEFLFEDGEFYFIEMNTRVQVEHPVTEAITGIDIVQEQIRVAAGEKLRFRQRDIQLKGHAIECRINARTRSSSRPRPDASPAGIRRAARASGSTRTPTRTTSCRRTTTR